MSPLRGYQERLRTDENSLFTRSHHGILFVPGRCCGRYLLYVIFFRLLPSMVATADFHFHVVLPSASSSVTSSTAMHSHRLHIFVHPVRPSHFLFPGSSILSILLPIYPSSFLRTCPNHLSLASRVFSPNRSNCAVLLMYSFLILSSMFSITNHTTFIDDFTISFTALVTRIKTLKDGLYRICPVRILCRRHPFS